MNFTPLGVMFTFEPDRNKHDLKTTEICDSLKRKFHEFYDNVKKVVDADLKLAETQRKVDDHLRNPDMLGSYRSEREATTATVISTFGEVFLIIP